MAKKGVCKMNVVHRLSGRIFNSYYGYNNGRSEDVNSNTYGMEITTPYCVEDLSNKVRNFGFKIWPKRGM